MGLLAWILVGLVAGWLADATMRGRGRGILYSIVLGVIGALVGGFLAANLLHIPDPLTGFDLRTLIVAFLGAVIVIAVIRALPGRSPV